MRAVVQRVSRASVTVDGEVVGSIGEGLLILLGVAPADGEAEIAHMADKVANLRIFSDEGGHMNLSVLDVGGEVLVVSQFTLYGDCRKGRRPSFTAAASPEHAEVVYERFVERLAELGVSTDRGRFGAMMTVSLENDGPVTLLVDSERVF